MKRFLGKPLVCTVILSMALFFAACGNNDTPTGGFQPGVFFATVPSFPATAMGAATSVSVRVEFSADRIVDVTITAETTEREPFRSAVAPLAQLMVYHQSTNVPVVSGATVSSVALTSAVRNTITQAGGGSNMFAGTVAVPETQNRSYNPDIVVVGSGVSGLAAAIAAAEANPTADILLIEKLGFFGGVTATSAGMIHGANNYVMRGRTGAVFTGDTPQTFADELIYLSIGLPLGNGGLQYPGKVAMLQAIAAQSGYGTGNTIDWLSAMNISFPASTTDPNNLGLAGNPNRAWRGTPFSRVLTPAGLGAVMIQRMVERAEDLDIELMTNMRAASLRGSSTAVTGVNAIDRDNSEVTINASQVILATGGFHNVESLMNRFHPAVGQAGFLGGSPTASWHLPGAYGQGLLMAEAAPINAGYRSIPTPISSVSGTPHWGIWVTPEGNRFFDESWQYGNASTAELNRLGFHYQWTIMRAPNIPAGLTANGATIFTAPDLETLVEEMGVEYADFYDNLSAAIAAYNAALPLAAGARLSDALFGSELGVNDVPVTGQAARTRHMRLDGEGAFWAQRSGNFSLVWGTNSGLDINQYGQVRTTAGTEIPGLWAAGEVVGWILPSQYGGSGMAITIWTNQARMAGAAAGNAAP